MNNPLPSHDRAVRSFLHSGHSIRNEHEYDRRH